jgi:hypothetical protein
MPEGTIFTCPMHPEIEQVGLGDCPIFGMALEPKGVPTGDESTNPELVDFTRRFWIGEGFSMRAVVQRCRVLGRRPALEILPRWKPRWPGAVYGESGLRFLATVERE